MQIVKNTTILFEPKLCKSDLLKLHGIAENFYRFLSYCKLDTAECNAHTNTLSLSEKTFFKEESKQNLGLGKYQMRNFSSQIACIAIIAMQYNILSAAKRFTTMPLSVACLKMLLEKAKNSV